MFKGVKPPGQPRTLRTIIESKNSSGGFPPPAPLPEDQHKGEYKEANQAATEGIGRAARTASGAEKSPFVVKGR